MSEETKLQIIKLLHEKSSMKQDVFANTIKAFNELKVVLKEVVNEIKPLVDAKDKRVTLEYKDNSEYEVQIKIAGDVLVFCMHTNIFEFENSHSIMKTSYVKENHLHSYCGLINAYNFLADSFKYNRLNDLGYLVARIFINSENHYFVEGKKKINVLHNDFVNSVLDKEKLKSIVFDLLLYCLEFDLFTPPFDSMREVSVYDFQQSSNAMQIKTGKRLGFKFQSEEDIR
ncbi:MAG: hypothetical protein V4667_11575 [Bacteroidota bacterium]